MDARKVVVIVEDMGISRTALKWALHNLIRYGDLITLLHVFPISRSRSKKKIRLLRLKGYQLALSFREICNSFPNSKTEIVVTEGDQEGGKIVDLVREIGASTLVVGLHDRSFLYRLAMSHRNIERNLNCKIIAIKQPTPLTTRRTTTISTADTSPSMDFSQIELAGLSFLIFLHQKSHTESVQTLLPLYGEDQQQEEEEEEGLFEIMQAFSHSSQNN